MHLYLHHLWLTSLVLERITDISQGSSCIKKRINLFSIIFGQIFRSLGDVWKLKLHRKKFAHTSSKGYEEKNCKKILVLKRFWKFQEPYVHCIVKHRKEAYPWSGNSLHGLLITHLFHRIVILLLIFRHKHLKGPPCVNGARRKKVSLVCVVVESGENEKRKK